MPKSTTKRVATVAYEDKRRAAEASSKDNSAVLDIVKTQVKAANLAYIPDVIRALQAAFPKAGNVKFWQERLISLEREGTISFQPESGQNRVSPDDKKYLIPMKIGGQSFELSWLTVRSAATEKVVEGAPKKNASPSSLEESPTRDEWEVVVTNPPKSARGSILNLAPPGDGYAAGNKIILQGFFDDEEAQNVAQSIARKYGCLVTYGPKAKVAAETKGAAETLVKEGEGVADHDCGCGGGTKTKLENTEVNVINVLEERRSATIPLTKNNDAIEPVGAICKPFTRIERDPVLFNACMLRAKQIGEFKNSKSFYELVAPELSKLDHEGFFVVCVDFRGQLRDFVSLAVGQRHKVAVDIEDILAVVLLSKCDGFCVAHTHPSGHADPSSADVRLTKDIDKAAKVACPNVPLLDHIVVTPTGYWSWRDNKTYKIR